MSKQFYLETFGCQMNVVDSERIVSLLEGIGYRQTEQPEMADLILLNTCSVRDKAERKVIGHLGRFKPLKEQRPGLILGVGGCVAQQEGAAFLEKLPHLDLVFGTHNIHKLPELVQRVEENRERCHEVEFLDRETRLRLFPQRSEGDSITRFVTVMQGCDNFCSYCIVPHVRGREVSRPSSEILAEVRQLAENGAREVTLIGQNVNSYGSKETDELSFAELLRAVHEIEGIKRIRFTTSHPKDLSDELVACFADLHKLAHHLHLPLQAGSDRVLKLMNRGYDTADYLAKAERLRQACPDMRFTTDLIVGFPGETEEDFLGTLKLVEQLRYSDAYTFLYSPRPGTAAAELSDGAPRELKQERFERLLEKQNRISEETWQSDVGKTLEVLVEGSSRQGQGQLFGRSSWNRIVNFSGPEHLIGRLVPVKVTRSMRNSQLGELVETESQAG